MKKFILVLLIAFLLIPFKVNASNFSTSMSGTTAITAGAQFTVTFNANSASNLKGIQGKITYDSNKLTVISSSGLNGFNATLGGNLITDSEAGRSGNFSFASITFRATGNFAVGESSTITFTNVIGSDGSTDLTGDSSSFTATVKSTNNNLSALTINGATLPGFSASKTSYSITVENNISTISISATPEDARSSVSGTGTRNLNVYYNTFNVIVTAENGSKKTYTVNISRKDSAGLTAPLSSNNNLASLTVEGYNIDFVNSKTEYNLTVENNINSLVIKATLEHAKATLAIDKSDNLIVGDNTINIIVVAENGTEKKYKLIVKRKSEGPTTTLDKIISVLGTTSSKVINVDINDNNNILTNDILKALKNDKVKVFITKYNEEKVLYKWEIDGSKINNNTPIDTLINFVTKNQKTIEEISNYANNLYLSFAYSGQLPSDTYLSVYVGDRYLDGEKIKLYYFDKDKEETKLIYDELEVKSGYVRFTLEHCSDYILTKANYDINEGNDNIIYLIVIGSLSLIVVCLVLFVTKLKVELKKFNRKKVDPKEVI